MAIIVGQQQINEAKEVAGILNTLISYQEALRQIKELYPGLKDKTLNECIEYVDGRVQYFDNEYKQYIYTDRPDRLVYV